MRLEDEEEWWQAIWCDPEVTLNLPPRKPLPRDVMPRFMQRVADHWQEHGLGTWSVRQKEGGELIGYTGLVLNEPPDVELTYAFTRSVWGQGIATEAAGCVAAFAFERRGLDQLTALIFPENAASAHVLEKLGFVPNGEVARFGVQLPRYILHKRQ